jgi:hypothetical protein
LRVQLFTAPGHRPVAVVTQRAEEGPSLTNWAERYAAAVWQVELTTGDPYTITGAEFGPLNNNHVRCPPIPAAGIGWTPSRGPGAPAQ